MYRNPDGTVAWPDKSMGLTAMYRQILHICGYFDDQRPVVCAALPHKVSENTGSRP